VGGGRTFLRGMAEKEGRPGAGRGGRSFSKQAQRWTPKCLKRRPNPMETLKGGGELTAPTWGGSLKSQSYTKGGGNKRKKSSRTPRNMSTRLPRTTWPNIREKKDKRRTGGETDPHDTAPVLAQAPKIGKMNHRNTTSEDQFKGGGKGKARKGRKKRGR